MLTFLLACLLTAPGAEPPGVPRVVAAWAAGPMEVRIAFDRPVDPGLAGAAVGLRVGFGGVPSGGTAPAASSPGRPGGDLGSLRVAAARLVDEGRTLVLVTDPHPRESTYSLALPGVKAPGDPGPGARVAVAYDLRGVEVSWAGDEAEGQKPAWSGWWPSLDPAEANRLTAGSAEHDRLRPLLDRPGRLTLHTLVTLPLGPTALTLRASGPFEATLGTESARSGPGEATLRVEATADPLDLSATLRTGQGGPTRLEATAGAGASAGRLHPPSLTLPWAPPPPSSTPSPEVPADILKGGNPVRGEAVFYGEQAKCANCHKVRGKGGEIGPDLTSLAGADRAWVYQNIMEPSASIHPDYVSYTAILKDGRVAMGVIRAEGADAIRVGDIDAKQTVIPRSEVEEIRPSASSIMPVGLLGAIGEGPTRDLLAFLTAPAPAPAGAKAR